MIKALVIPKLKSISERIESCIEGPGLSNIDKNGAGHIKSLLVVSIIVIILFLRIIFPKSKKYDICKNIYIFFKIRYVK